MSQIITAEDLASYTKKTLDTTQAALTVAAVNRFIETETKRVWGEEKQLVERYDWAPVIWLRRMDIKSIDSVKLGYPGQLQTVVTSDSYLYNGRGRLTMYLSRSFNPSPVNNDLVEITYTTGYSSDGYAEDGTTPLVPADLKIAALALAAGMYNYASTDQKKVTMAMVGQYRLMFDGTGEDQYSAIIKSYKVRRV